MPVYRPRREIIVRLLDWNVILQVASMLIHLHFIVAIVAACFDLLKNAKRIGETELRLELRSVQYSTLGTAYSVLGLRSTVSGDVDCGLRPLTCRVLACGRCVGRSVAGSVGRSVDRSDGRFNLLCDDHRTPSLI